MANLQQFSELCDVEFYAKKTADAALQTLTLVGANQDHGTYETAMYTHFAKLADILGFDLVKREDKKEAA